MVDTILGLDLDGSGEQGSEGTPAPTSKVDNDTWTASVTLGHTLVGTMALPVELMRGEIRPPNSYAYFCPHCAEVWARVTIEGRRYMVWTHCCWSCRDKGARLLEEPGSMMMQWEPDFNRALPRAIKLNEFEQAVQMWELRDG